MKPNKVIFPLGTLSIFPPGMSAGDRGGTVQPVEGNFHGKPESPPLPAILEKAPHMSPYACCDPSEDADGLVRRWIKKRALLGVPPDWLVHAIIHTYKKQPVEYEHRPLSPPGGGLREHAQGPPSSWTGPIPPGHTRSPWREPPGGRNIQFTHFQRKEASNVSHTAGNVRQGRRSNIHKSRKITSWLYQ